MKKKTIKLCFRKSIFQNYIGLKYFLFKCQNHLILTIWLKGHNLGVFDLICFFHTIYVIYPTYLNYYYYYFSPTTSKPLALPFLSSPLLLEIIHLLLSTKEILSFLLFYISNNSQLFLKSSHTLRTLSVQYDHLVSTWAWLVRKIHCFRINKYFFILVFVKYFFSFFLLLCHTELCK